jgi:protoheme IX farnesyltransferase
MIIIPWRSYLELCKPRVVALMLLTAIVGMYLAATGPVPWKVLIFGTLGIGLLAGSAATINHLVDYRIDSLMTRTQKRPLPSGQITSRQAWYFATGLGLAGMLILCWQVNWLTAILTLSTLIGYAGIYTLYLKRATSQNIVIGGLAGAAPPLLGWTAVTGQIEPHSLLLVLIIFVWTPPHFWSLAIYRHKEYARVAIPMLPVTHGIAYTKRSIVFYTLLLFAVSLLPFATKMSGLVYLFGTVILGLGFLFQAVRLLLSEKEWVAMATFRYSIVYLMCLFVVLLIDHYYLLVN